MCYPSASQNINTIETKIANIRKMEPFGYLVSHQIIEWCIEDFWLCEIDFAMSLLVYYMFSAHIFSIYQS